MKKPRRIEFEFAGVEEGESYHYWQQYAEALEEYIAHLEGKKTDVPEIVEPPQGMPEHTSLLLEYADLLKGYGFAVYAFQPDKRITQLFFEKNYKIGTVMEDKFFGVTFMSVNKPHSRAGNGFVTDANILEPDVTHAVKAMDFYRPEGAGFESVSKYASFKHYKDRNTILTYREL